MYLQLSSVYTSVYAISLHTLSSVGVFKLGITGTHFVRLKFSLWYLPRNKMLRKFEESLQNIDPKVTFSNHHEPMNCVNRVQLLCCPKCIGCVVWSKSTTRFDQSVKEFRRHLLHESILYWTVYNQLSMLHSLVLAMKVTHWIILRTTPTFPILVTWIAVPSLSGARQFGFDCQNFVTELPLVNNILQDTCISVWYRL